LRIRHELPADDQAIHDLTLKAFAPMSFSNGSEAPMVRALRAAGDLTLSLVAEDDGKVVGHVAFSPATVDGRHDGWFGLGPVSVHPDRQRQGIGKLLIEHGLDLLREAGANGCALIGNPAIYSRLGFESDGLLTYRGLPVRDVQRIVLAGSAPRGELRFAAALES
jgi:putative acetyltransferase